MRTFLIALLSFVAAISSGCAGRRVTETAPPAEANTTHETIDPVAKECFRLATFRNGVEETPVPGWTLASPARTYDEKSIFDYINGAAELYFAYDFRAVAAAEYQDGETSVIIDVYDMTTPAGAFGIYSLNRYPEANYVDIGNEGILTDTNLDFWKGQYFCKVYSFDMSEKYQRDVVNFGGRLASNIEEAGAEPSVIGILPKDGLMPKTVKSFSRKLGLDNIHYVSKENILNLSSETEGVVAEYQIDSAGFQFFVIEYPSLDAASSAFEAYSSHLEKEAELLSTDGARRGSYKTFLTGDKFTFVGLKDENLWGLWDVGKPESVESTLQNILPFPR
ncbi:DUF6599 family protein [Candidatus Poribacteria bacterium]